MEERLGRYQLVRRLGDNDLCDAYTALQHGDGGFVREVLVKRLKDALTTETSALRAFQGEALLLARLRQRSIPHVYDLQRDPKSGAWFIALEFIPGPTLKWVMETERERRTPLPMALALSVVSQLCAAVHHMHELTNTYGQPSELVHRNLAPENVVLGRDGLARLMDFGCAVPRSDLDATGSDGRGAAGYMAPEQILGSEPPDRRADVFVLGVLLYEMTTGVRLYDGRGERLRRALMDVDAPPASTRRSGFPAVLDEILAGALARDPSSRPATADVLQRQIEGFAAAQRIQLGTARVGAYLAEAFPPGSERQKDGSPASPLPAPRGSVPPGPRTSLPPGRYNSSAPPPPRRSSSPPAEESTDLDGLALAAAGAPSEENEFEAEDTMVGQSQAPPADSRRPSLGPPRPSTGVYLHVGVTTEDVKKKP
jgi:serine/threonine protein kinase